MANEDWLYGNIAPPAVQKVDTFVSKWTGLNSISVILFVIYLLYKLKR